MENINLSIGATGNKVQTLHHTLIGKGFTIPKNELDKKYFGKGTQQALIQWQKEQRLVPTGEVDRETAHTLEAIEIPKKQESINQKTPPDVILDRENFENKETDATARKPLISSRQKKRLSNLTKNIPNEKQKARLEVLFTETEGNFKLLKTKLAEDPEFEKETIERIVFSQELSELLEDQENLVTAFVNNNTTNSLRDVAFNTKKEDFKKYITVEDIPQDIEGETEEERLELFVNRIEDRLFHMEPTGVIHRMLQDKEIVADNEPVRAGLLSFFENQPELDFRKTSVLKILQHPDSLKSVPEVQREAVVDRLKKLQRLSSVSSKAEALPVLLNKGLHSAYAVNEIPMNRFVARYAESMGGADAARAIHRNASTITARNEESYIALRSAVLGTGVYMVNGGGTTETRMAELYEYAVDHNIPVNFETLFGSVDLCECDHCNSVYSPAAYLVELFQYLRNNNLDPDHVETGDTGIDGTVLQKFFRRRPDLGRLQLTCENTNTLIPYIDLVNEVMESFVENLENYITNTEDPKQASIRIHNVDDETSGQLLAEPQHTNYSAYETLKDTVYPVCKLPYHQPIDAIRQYLDFLGSSRYEVLKTFRKAVFVELEGGATPAEIEAAEQWEALQVTSVDRAIASEYLNLTEEEYVILTKEGYHTRDWYELENQTDLTLAEYHEEIGLKDTWEYYGIEDESQMLDELKWVKPSQKTGIVGFLRRTNIKYTDLIELLKTRYINPNYPSGKDLAYMNSLRYSYRYLQSLVDDNQADITLRYQDLVQFLHQDLNNNLPSPFSAFFVACWAHRLFEKIGKIIVLDNSTECKCIEGRLQLEVRLVGETHIRLLQFNLNEDCEIISLDRGQVVGHLNSHTGQLEPDLDFLNIDEIILALFTGNNGEVATVTLPDLILQVDGQLMVCTDPHENCDISKTQLKHLDGTDLETEEYDRFHRFIRLWCKLDWEVAEVDQAITGIGEAAEHPIPVPENFFVFNNWVSLVPTGDPDGDDGPGTIGDTLVGNRPPDPETIDDITIGPNDPLDPDNIGDLIDTPFDLEDCRPEPISQVGQEITPYLIEQLAAIKELLRITGLELSRLLTYWTTIGIYGEKSLYKRLFLQYNLIAIDDIFKEDDFGTFPMTEVGDDPALISDHLPILMAALKVDAPNIETIMNLASLEGDETMSMESVSTIYRYVLLQKTLGLRVTELSGLLSLTKDTTFPFGKPTQTLEFYQLFTRIENSGFGIRELNYMLLNEDDPKRPLRPSMADIFGLAVALRNALLKIETDHANVEIGEEATEEFLRTKLGLLYDGDTSEAIIGLLQGTTIYTDNTRRRFSTQLEEADQLALTDFFLERLREEEAADEPGDFHNFLARVKFSGDKGLQVTGILNDEEMDRVNDLANSISDTDDAENFGIVVTKINAQPERFFDDVLSVIFGDDPNGAKDILLASDHLNPEDTNEHTPFLKQTFFTEHFMPYLREELRKRLVLQTIAGEMGLEMDITRALVMDIIETDEGNSLYTEIIRLKEQKDADAEEQHWEGFFVPEKDGNYTFLLEAEGDATLTLKNRTLLTLIAGPDDEGINFYQSAQRFLNAGQDYRFVLDGYDEDNDGNILGLFMKFENQPKVKISDKVLFPALRTEAFLQAYIRLQKTAMLVDGFKIKLPELDFFRDFPDTIEGLDFNALGFPQWLRLESFYRFQKSLSSKELTLIEFLEWTNFPESQEEVSLTGQIHVLTGWEIADIHKMLLPRHFNLNDPIHFEDEINLHRLQETLTVAKKLSVGIGELFRWGNPVSSFQINRRRAGDIREVIRARYSHEEWEEAIKPVHDTLRENQKQALIAYLLAQPVLMEWGVVDADSLFEFFLIDVQMDACMETSRIKQAISSVQLYVQRCFLGLEEEHGVGADALDLDRWEWMQRYRSWEANRKVFLYPENWIEPGLRDTKSPFFKEMESELLQNDVSKDTVKAALTKYIVQVDEVANLQAVGQFTEWEEGEQITLHVIGRTRNAPYFFYYRSYSYITKEWLAWGKVEGDFPSIDIKNETGHLERNGTYVMPVVWNNRLFVFFPEFMEKSWNSPLKNRLTVSDNAETTGEDSSPLPYWEIKMGWSEYKEGRWTPKQISNTAIDSLINFRENVSEAQNQTEHVFDLLTEQEKFKFAPFVRSEGIYIQPYYSGDIADVTETLNQNQHFFSRGISTVSEKIMLEVSFGFNGNEIRTQVPTPNAEIPGFLGNRNAFQHISIDPLILFPIQAVENENNPVNYFSPRFIENNGSTNSVFFIENNDTYSFEHTETKIILGLLRKDRLNKVFDVTEPIISLSDDNYGSNNFGIEYHELLRPYAIYNWEMLFHSVAMLADNLSKSQRFEESMQWWHYIFDPRRVDGGVNMAWKFLPFRVTDSENILDQIFNSLEPNTSNDKITEWRNNPFNPHLIARNRPTAYMKWVVMKYIDNLIAWGDQLFRQDRIESINQATQLYILAGHILGPRPEIIPKRGKIHPQSYRSLLNKWDAFSNAMVDMELIFPFSNQITTPQPAIEGNETHFVNIYGFATTMYFCIPNNPKLMAYWDTVADRLFKIRHCLNIEGVFRKLNLFEPPIDPALLVQAAAQGLSIASVLNDLSTPMPNYRFNYLLARALEVTSEVKSLGSALLSALEKKDGEALSLLRAQHDTNIQNLILQVRELQLEEAEKSLKSLEQNRKAPEYRLNHYLQLAGEGDVSIPAIDTEFAEVENLMPDVKEESGMKLIPTEAEEVKKAKLSADLQVAVGSVETLASILSLIPSFDIDIKPFGVGGGFTIGGNDFQNATNAIARGLQIGVNVSSAQSSAASRKTGFTRQFQDRIFQANLAGHELMQIDKQITAQKIRIAVAQKELENHEVQIEQTKEVEEFVRTKFSNEQLYQWMGDQLKDLYYQTYSFAYDMAKKAEKVYRFDMGLSTTDFIKFGYWDSSREGFLAGEQLYMALKQLENAYIETKPHDFEITKHISLQQLNPLALILLKEEGSCEFDIPETLFDLDYAGHYKRRIKTVSVSIPCIAGPYTSLNCTLRLLNHEYRNSKLAANASDYAKKLEEADERFVYNPIPITAIAVSQGQNDSGAFDLNFNSERFMPFEGAGSISRWRLELPEEFRQFDYQTITDVILHLSYTSCEGGTTLKNVALENLSSYVRNAAGLSKQQGIFRMLSLKHEFPDEWHRLLHPRTEVEQPIFVLGNLRDRLPFFANSQKVNNLSVHSIMLFTAAQGLTITVLKSAELDTLDSQNATFTADLSLGAAMGQLQQYIVTDQEEDLNGFWGLQFDQNEIVADELKNSWLVIKYQLEIEM